MAKIQHRRDTAANWTSANPTLAVGEPAYETDTGYEKIGDGSTAWNSLPYAPSAALLAAKAPLPSNSKNGLTGWYHVDGYGADKTGATSSTTAVQAAVNAIVAAGGSGRLYYPAGFYRHDFIDIKNCNGLVIQGDGRGVTTISTTVGRTSTLSRIFGSTGSCSNILFTGITFQGTAVDDLATDAQPRRSRSYSSFGFNCAILLQGDLVPATSGGTDPDPAKFPITNVVVSDVEVIGSGGYANDGTTPTYSGLPIFLQGIRGEARIERCRFYNTLDVGWTFCEHAIAIGNRSYKSADNGFSMSRGNKAITAIGNRTYQCAYWALWISGFNGDLGPRDIVASGNSGAILGYGGIIADIAPQNISISGGVFRQIYRGPSDGPTDSYGVGVMVSGYPSRSATPTNYAQNFTISGVTVVDASRGGIIVSGATNGGIYGNTIIRPGTTFLVDGTTTITTGMATQNFGISADANVSGTVSNVDVQSNTIIDDRSTPVLNNAVYGGSATNWTQSGNRATGNRLQIAESARTWNSGAQIFTALLTATAGLKVGSLGAASTVAHRISAPAGILRELRYESSDVIRWSLRANTTAESGSNVGSDMQLISYADDGTTVLNTIYTIARTGSATFGVQAQPLTLRSRLVSGAATTTLAAGANSSAVSPGGNGSNDMAGTVNATVVASGAVAGGALVVVTFATPYTTTPHVVISAQSSPSQTCAPYVGARSNTGFSIFSANVPAAGQALQYDYFVIG